MFVNTPQQLAEKKLLLLYILDKINQPISNTQITEFVLENDMMNYFMLQQFLSELKESEFIIEEKNSSSQFLTITEKGRNTLNYFINRIPSSVKKEINKLVSEKKSFLKNKTEVKSHYTKVNEELFLVKLSIIKDNICIINLNFHVTNLNKAQEICKKWQKDGENIYKNITSLF